MPGCPQFYGFVSADQLVALGLARRTEILPAEVISIPGLDFGEQDLSGRTLNEQPGGVSWRDEGGALAGPAPRYVFRNARVHSAMGVVTVGRHVVSDTLMHVWPPQIGARKIDDGLWAMLDDYAGRRSDRAEHLMCGNSDNYYHWLLDAVGRWGAVPEDGAPVLLPTGGAGFQVELASLLPGLTGRAVPLATGEAVEVEELGWTPNLTGAGLAFHPVLLRVADALLAATHAERTGPEQIYEQIYVSRADASRRRLRNEAEVEAICAARGFQVIRLAGMPLARQIALFASARRIVAPHGAGLANLLFCRRGTALLELHMDHYVNWCFRRLAGLRVLRYGCLVGEALQPAPPDWVHDAEWVLDPAVLRAALDDPRFAPG